MRSDVGLSQKGLSLSAQEKYAENPEIQDKFTLFFVMHSQFLGGNTYYVVHPMGETLRTFKESC